MTKKILIAIAILTGVFAFTFVSCNDDDEESVPNKNHIVGTWIEKNPQMFDDGIIDTITFLANGTVNDKTGIFDGCKYYLVGDTMIKFKDPDRDFLIKFNSDFSEVTFCNFVDLLITEDVKDITYFKK